MSEPKSTAKLQARLLVAGLVMLVLPEITRSAVESGLDTFVGGVGVGSMHFDLKEFDSDDDQLVHESGRLPGIDAFLKVRRNRAEIWLHTAYANGDIDYDGQTQSGMAIGSSTDVKIWDLTTSAAYRLPVSIPADTYLYVGTGYRHWNRNIQSVGSIAGLDETYRWWSSQAGVKLEWRHGANQWTLDGRLTRPLNPEVNVDFKQSYDSVNLDLGERWGWKTELSWKYAFSSRFAAGVKGFYESWKLGNSASETLSQGGIPVGSVLQPRIENRNYGVGLELRQHWQ